MKRLLQGVITLFGVVTILFFILRALPGGPFDEEQVLAPEAKARLEQHYGLNRPLISQYITYISHLARGDMGESYRYQSKTVTQILSETLPATFSLGLMSLVTSYIFGISLGLTSVDPQSKKWGKVVQFLSNCGSSMPPFLSGPILIMLFSFTLDIFPPALWDGPKYYVLPVLALSIRPTSLVTRLIRSSALENIHADFIRAALAKGISDRVVLFKHVLKNSLIPLLSISGSLFAQILSGGFIVEEIFAVPGVARYFVESVENRDYLLVMGLASIYCVLLIAFNIVFDFLAARIDPRIEHK